MSNLDILLVYLQFGHDLRNDLKINYFLTLLKDQK